MSTLSRLPPSPSSFREFSAMFPDEASCIEYLSLWRWPDGFVCPRCDGRDSVRLRSRPLWECKNCGRQTSVTAGTVLHRTRMPLTTWLYAMWQFSIRKTSISAKQLQRETGLASYGSAWTLLHKLRRALDEDEGSYLLDAASIEVDETKVFGLGKAEGRVGRRLPAHCAWIVAAVERIDCGHGEKTWQASGSARVQVIEDTTAETLCGFVERTVVKGRTIVTDGWSSYNPLPKRGYHHVGTTLGKDHALADAIQPKVHLFFSNLKALLIGTFHGISIRYLADYLREVVYRFNRRSLGHELFGYVVRRAMTRPWVRADKLQPESAG